MTSKTTDKLLHALSDQRFHSGEKLAQMLGLSRSAVWKALQQLKARGVMVQSIQGRGYRLDTPITRLNADTILAAMDKAARTQLDELIVLDNVDSTNTFLMQYTNPAHKTLAVLAEQQQKGRGRRDRTWVSPYGTNLYLSLRLHTDKALPELMGLSLVCALSLLRAFKAYGLPADFQVKWPNDIMWQHKKIAGILIEMIAQPHDCADIVIGIGINTQMPAHSAHAISQPWATLADTSPLLIDRNRLAGIVLSTLLEMTRTFLNTGLTPFLPEWKEHDAFDQQPARIHMGNTHLDGVCEGITARGELVLRLADNTLKMASSGEVQLRAHTVT